MIKNLRKKFILVAMCSMFAVLAAIMGAVNLTNYVRVLRHADELTEILAKNDGRLDRPVLENGTRQGRGPKDVLSPETPYETRFFAVQLDANGKILSSDTEHIAAVSESDAKAYAEQVFEKEKETGFCGVYRYLKTTQGEETTIIFVDCRRELDNFKNLALISVLVSGMGLLAVFILVLIFSKLVFRPVAESYGKQKQFITDASHEIKTPLTIIDANTEVLEMEMGENQWTKSTRNQIRRLTDLTNQLVTLARLDEEGRTRVQERFSISDVVIESVSPFEALARAQGKKMQIQIEDGIFFTGDEKGIRQLLGILMDNAVKYSSVEGWIRVQLRQKGKKIYLEVWNQTEEIAKGRQDILFERFYRMDHSRNSKTGGSGIGLSVAKALALAQKGKITAYSQDGKSLTISVVLEYAGA